MARALTICCDACGRHLYGKKGVTFVQEEHLAIKGSFTKQSFDRYNQPDHYFITEDPTRQHHFCNWKCLQDFSAYREKRYQDILAAKRKRDARIETNV